MDIMNYGIREKDEQLKKFGDRLSDMKDIIDWDRIESLLSDLYRNDTEKGDRPNFDLVFMMKIMFLQSLYGLVDVAMETELYSNIRFINIWITGNPYKMQEPFDYSGIVSRRRRVY